MKRYKYIGEDETTLKNGKVYNENEQVYDNFDNLYLISQWVRCYPNDWEEFLGFIKGSYVVITEVMGGTRCYSKDYCYKTIATHSWLRAIDNNGDGNGMEMIKFSSDNWRYATEEEIAEYKRQGKPFDTKTLIEADKEAESVYPKRMLVSNYSYFPKKAVRLVVGEVAGKFIAVSCLDEDRYNNGEGWEATVWKYAKDISEKALPEIGGQQGERVVNNGKDCVKYGCSVTPIDFIRTVVDNSKLSSGTDILSVTVTGGFEISLNQLKEIVEYFKEK